MDQTKTIAALFDFDGVVMDTESQYSIFWNGVGKKYHPNRSIAFFGTGWERNTIRNTRSSAR